MNRSLHRDADEINRAFLTGSLPDASGEVAGGVMGDDSPSGVNYGWAVTSARLAAENIAEELVLEATA